MPLCVTSSAGIICAQFSSFNLLRLFVPAAADPVANDDSFVQNPNGPTKVPVPGVLANDEVPCGDKAVLTVTKPPSFGSVYLDDSGEWCMMLLASLTSRPVLRTCDLPGDRGFPVPASEGST